MRPIAAKKTHREAHGRAAAENGGKPKQDQKQGTKQGHDGHSRTPGSVWRETTLIGIDVRGWRQRQIDERQSRRLLDRIGDYLQRRFDPRCTEGTSSDAPPRAALLVAATGSGEAPDGSQGLPPGCELVRVEFRECRDGNNRLHMCRCELYECADRSFWQCVMVE